MLRHFQTLFLLLVLTGLAFGQDVILQGDITSNTTLTADKTYLLSGFVRVKEGVTLTIEPGTVIYGELSSLGTLIIQLKVPLAIQLYSPAFLQNLELPVRQPTEIGAELSFLAKHQ